MFPRVEARPQREILEIIQLLCPMGINKSDLTESKSDVAEIYLRAIRRDLSPRANAFGLRPGFAIDLTIEKDDGGDHWDLSRKKDQDELRMLQKVERPLFLVGSPPCGPFSPLQNLSKHKRTEEENQAILAEGKTHLKVACDAYEERCRNGRFVLHEHPKPAASWQEDCVQRIRNLKGVYTVQSPMCKWKMLSEDSQGLGYVRKEEGSRST